MTLTAVPAAGAKLRASTLLHLVTEARAISIRKSADETINAVGTLQNDDVLFVPLEANAVYFAKLRLTYQSNATPGFKFGWTFPSGTTLPQWSFTGITTVPAFTYGLCVSGGVSGLGGTAADQALDAQGVIIVASTAGNLQLQWCQNTSNASNTIVRAGSEIVLTRVE
jgi:hypothetical protein